MYSKTLVAAAVALLPVQAFAVTVPNTFVDGQPAIAGEVNANFKALEAAINSIGAPGLGPSFEDYLLRPSSDGATTNRNVIVYAGEGASCWVARLWFTNTTGIQVQSASSIVTPETVFVWQMVCGDAFSVDYELEYVYALPAAGFDQAQAAEIREDGDGDGTFDHDSSWDYRGATTVTPLANAELRLTSEMYRDGANELVTATSSGSILTELGEPLTVNGMVFDDVAIRHFIGFQRLRFHAKGIGSVYEIAPQSITGLNSDPRFDSQRSRKVIFYRVEGASPTSQGSLAGTPFLSGDMIKLWFQ